MSALVTIPLTLLAQGIYTGLIGTISAFTIKTCNLVNTLYARKNSNVTKIVRELDIERRIRLIQSILNKIDQESKYYTRVTNDGFNDLEKTQIFNMIGSIPNLNEDPIEICLIYLKETIQEIHNDLSNIDNKIMKHNTKWFKNWRTLNIQENLDNLKLNSKLLESRFDDLTKVSIFMSNKNK
jgi:hypothetical protein